MDESVGMQIRSLSSRTVRFSSRLLIPLSAVVLSLSSCHSGQVPALGEIGEVGLVLESPEWNDSVSDLKEVFERDVARLTGERGFSLIPIAPYERRDWKSHLVLCNLREEGRSGLLRALLSPSDRSEMARQPVGHRFFRDVWASGQVVLLLHADSPIELKRYLHEQADEIYNGLEDRLIDLLSEGLFAGGEEDELEAILAWSHPFRLRIPIGYELAEGDGAIELRRLVPEEPKRWLLVHYGESSNMPRLPAEWMQVRDRAVQQMRPGDEILESQTAAKESHFQGGSSVELVGIWQNKTYAMGGPFRSYGFVRGDLYFLIDLSVFHPPAPKLPALRHLMAIARTFEV